MLRDFVKLSMWPILLIMLSYLHGVYQTFLLIERACKVCEQFVPVRAYIEQVFCEKTILMGAYYFGKKVLYFRY